MNKEMMDYSNISYQIFYKRLSFFIFLFSIFFCSCKVNSKRECPSTKIDLLLYELFQKEQLLRILPKVKNLDPNLKYLDNEIDNSAQYHYLYLENITLPKKEYFLLDTIKLIPVNKDFLNKKNKDANLIWISIIEYNKDTSKIKVDIGCGSTNSIFLNQTTYNYSYIKDSCKWVVRDSTFMEY